MRIDIAVDQDSCEFELSRFASPVRFHAKTSEHYAAMGRLTRKEMSNGQ